MHMKITLQELLTKTEQADGTEIDEIINALSRRYQLLHPDWEITFLSLPRYDPKERIRILNQIMEFERQ